MEVPKKFKIEILCDPAIPLPGIYPKKMRTLIQKYVTTHVNCSIIDIRQDMEETEVSTDIEWIKET